MLGALVLAPLVVLADDMKHKGVACLAVTPDGALGATGGWDKTIRIWDLAKAKEVRKIEAHTDAVVALAFSADGKLLASGSVDHTARVFDAATGKETAKLLHKAGVESVAFSPDGKQLATGSEDTFARLFDLATQQEKKKLEGHRRKVRSVAYAPDGKLLATASGDETVKLWDSSGKLVRMLEAEGGRLTCVVFSPDEKVTESELQVSQSMGVDESSPKTTVALPAKDAPTLETYFQIEKASEVAFSDEKKTVGVREFSCKKVTFVTPSGAKTLHSTAWISTDVKGSGLVALRIETDADGKKITLDFEVAGFGSKDKTDFGKTAAELAKALGGDEKK